MSIQSTLEYRTLDARVRNQFGNSGINGSTPVAPPLLNIVLKGATGATGITPTQINGAHGSPSTNPISTHIGSTGLIQLGETPLPGQDGEAGPPALPAIQGLPGDPYTFHPAYASESGSVDITTKDKIATIRTTGWYEIVQNGQFYIPIMVKSTHATTRIFAADGIVSGNSQVWNGKLYAGDEITIAPGLQITRIA